MHWVKSMAEAVRENRRPAAADNPFVRVERQASERIEQSLDAFRGIRDDMYEGAFKAIYGSPWLAAAVGLSGESVRRRGPRAPTWEYQELKRLKRLMAESQIEQGTALDGWVRIVLYVAREERVFDERPYNLARRMIDERSPQARLDRKSTRLNSSHVEISYAVFCLKKK